MKPERAAKLAWLDDLLAEQDGTGCRIWPWWVSAKGYAQLRWGDTNRRVGHIVLERSGRPRPSASHHQLHSCDRPSCVAPWHLRWGTNLENRREAVARGRHAHKLTDEQVRAIRNAKGATQRSLAEQYGVTQRVVWGIRSSKTWRHVA